MPCPGCHGQAARSGPPERQRSYRGGLSVPPKRRRGDTSLYWTSHQVRRLYCISVDEGCVTGSAGRLQTATCRDHADKVGLSGGPDSPSPGQPPELLRLIPGGLSVAPAAAAARVTRPVSVVCNRHGISLKSSGG